MQIGLCPPFSWFESHYNLTAASLEFEHGQLTNWNIYYRKTEGQNMFATPTTSVQRAWLLVYVLDVFFSFFSRFFYQENVHAFLLWSTKGGEDTLIIGRFVYCACVCEGKKRGKLCKITDVQTWSKATNRLTARGRKGTGVHLYVPPMCGLMHPRKSVCAFVCDSLSAAQQVSAAVSTRQD